jgi:hypothetical protein
MSNPNFDLTMEEIQPIRTEADAVHQQTLLGMEPVALEPCNIYAVRTITGYETIDLTKEEVLRNAGYNRERPVARYAFYTVDSFVTYANGIFARRMVMRAAASLAPDEDGTPAKNVKSGLFQPLRVHAMCMADETVFTIRLIFDAQPNQWGDIVADLVLHKSAEAERWERVSGKYLIQKDFAEFCELNLQSFSSPAAATILEIAQTFQAKTTVDFASAVRLSNGAFKLKREEKVEATAGERADLIIPEELRLALPLFKYGKTYEVRGRLRYRIMEGSVRLSVLLVDPEMAFEHAFREVVDECQNRLQMQLYWGRI